MAERNGATDTTGTTQAVASPLALDEEMRETLREIDRLRALVEKRTELLHKAKEAARRKRQAAWDRIEAEYTKEQDAAWDKRDRAMKQADAQMVAATHPLALDRDSAQRDLEMAWARYREQERAALMQLVENHPAEESDEQPAE